MRSILYGLTRLTDFSLHILKQDQDGLEKVKAGHPDVLRITMPMIHMTGISAHSLLKLTEEVGLSTRDCFPIGRAIVESAINVTYILAGGSEVALRAERHDAQRSFRDLERTLDVAGLRIMAKHVGKLDAEALKHYQNLAREFSYKSGKEKSAWTDDALEQRLEVVKERFSQSIATSLSVAMFGIYRHSSEILHGSYFGAMFFWGRTRPSVDPMSKATREGLIETLSEHQFSILSSVVFAVSAMLQAFGEYIDRADNLSRQASSMMMAIQDLPLIRDALAPNGG